MVTLDAGPPNASSISDIQDLVRQAARERPPGAWILGRGYHEFDLAEKRHPTRWDLDIASPVHPVKIAHRSGHTHVLNSLALKRVGISMETGDPPDGLIDRDLATGEPTGLVHGMNELLARFLAATQDSQAETGIRMAGASLAALGITSIHDASSRNDWSRRDLFRTWQQRGHLPQRTSMVLGWEAFQGDAADEGDSADDGHVRVAGVKIIVHETTGRLSPSQLELNDMVLRIHQAGQQAVLHAIDEKQVTAACIAIEHALKTSPRADHRHRIEHCSVCPPALAKQMASAGITVVTQPAFVYYDGGRYLRTVPSEELEHLYPVATLKQHGVRVAGSSDFPVVPPNPLVGIYAAVTRRAADGEHVLSKERIGPLEALSLFTVDAAHAIRAETGTGSIRPGTPADLVLLSGDPTGVPEEEIKDIRVDMTMIDGQVVWERA